jgi:hypothetical protein
VAKYDLASNDAVLKLVSVSKKHIVTFDGSKFFVFDATTKALKFTVDKPMQAFGVSAIAVSRRRDTLAFTQGNVLYLKDLSADSADLI